MSKQFMDAIGMIDDDIRRSGVVPHGRLPTLITIQFQEKNDEVRFYSWLKSQKEMIDCDPRHIGSLRENCQFVVSGMAVRLTSDRRIDDIVRSHFK